MQTIEVRLDPDAEVVEKLCRDHEVRIYPNALGTFTAVGIHKDLLAELKKNRGIRTDDEWLKDDFTTDDVTPVKALVRLAYKLVFRRIVKWAEVNEITPEDRA